ncbi:MAG: GTP-binding protein [Bacteroidales bacterium]|nr:GTP-binding protein [Lachnoclostridium sp.]MCM1384816.1 GTP-binding protein [Lachnoclostridium sp.]MCM1466417.1 GTP-binding protein [Bacteroidales bacterium]
MTKIDVVSGFLGAGKTTLIKKLLKEALDGSKTVLIENEFGEIGIDGGFLKEAGIEIKEMNSGCICCSLVGDFGASLKEVINTYAPERILIEPSGVGKLSDVLKAVEDVAASLDVQINSAVAVVDASKCKMYIKNFGEFFINQIAYAGTIILSRTDKLSDEKISECVTMIREHNEQATIITTPLAQLDGKAVLETIEGADKLEDLMKEMMEKAKEEHEHHHHDHDHGEDCECGCHGHEHHHHDEDDEHDHDHEEHEHHHHDHDEHEHHHHDHDEHEHHHHDHDEHEHHHHDHEEHEHHDHDHEEHEHHHHHHADEIFSSWGMETPNKYSREEIEQILNALDSGEYGVVLRAKGMVPAKDGTWIYYDYVPKEQEIRTGNPEVTGKICVIGSKLDEEKLAALFRK